MHNERILIFGYDNQIKDGEKPKKRYFFKED